MTNGGVQKHETPSELFNGFLDVSQQTGITSSLLHAKDEIKSQSTWHRQENSSFSTTANRKTKIIPSSNKI